VNTTPGRAAAVAVAVAFLVLITGAALVDVGGFASEGSTVIVRPLKSEPDSLSASVASRPQIQTVRVGLCTRMCSMSMGDTCLLRIKVDESKAFDFALIVQRQSNLLNARYVSTNQYSNLILGTTEWQIANMHREHCFDCRFLLVVLFA
jgi:hypothetical protein